jgi:hypothetical protein
MLINKELILTHKEFAETIIERLQGKKRLEQIRLHNDLNDYK